MAREDGGDPFAAARVAISVRPVAGGSIDLEQGDRLVVGRTPESPLASLCGDNISYRHAEIFLSDEAAFIVDTDSTNGTFMNGERLPTRVPRAVTSTVSVRFGADPPLVITIEVRDRE